MLNPLSMESGQIYVLCMKNFINNIFIEKTTVKNVETLLGLFLIRILQRFFFTKIGW